MTSSFVMWTWHSNIVMSHVQCLIYMIHLCRWLAFCFSGVGWLECVFCNKIENYKEKWRKSCLMDISERSLGNGCGLSWILRSLYENSVPMGDGWWTLTILLLGVMMLPLNPTPNTLQCPFHLSCASKKKTDWQRESKERELTAAPSFKACCWILKKIKYHYWNLKKKVIQSKIHFNEKGLWK